MNSNLKWKALFIVGVILVCIVGLVGIPDSPPKSLAAIKSNFSNRIKLGLDLQGGTHLILQVQVQEAVSQETDQTLDHINTLFQDKTIRYDEIRKLSDTQILVHNIAPEQAGTARNLISDQFPDWNISPAPGEASGYVITMSPSRISNIQQQTMDQAEETIRRRIDALGLTEPLVAPYGQGDNEIIVELPGEGDPNRAKSVIQAGGQLELHLVLDNTPYSSEAAAMAAHGGVLPPNAQLVQGKSAASTPGQPSTESWYLIDRVPVVTGRDLRSATAVRSTKNIGFFDVDFTLSTEAGRRFGPFTEQNIGKELGIVLEHRLQTAPVINGRIDDTGVIEGQFGEQEANDLGLVLRSGALPASIKYLEERTVGPSLGRGLDPPRRAGFDRQPAGRFGLHGCLLPALRSERGRRAASEPGHFACGAGIFRRRAHPARHCRRDPDDRHGRRFERPDFRAHPGRTACGESAGFGRGPRI